MSVTVTGLDDATDLAAGNQYTCASRAGGAPVCWGQNDSGQFGEGTMLGRSTPVASTEIRRDAVLAAGRDHYCAVLADGIYCWGHGRNGQLGTGRTMDENTPRRVVGLPED